MIIAKVIGNVWASHKEDSLSGMKLMVVEQLDYSDKVVGNPIVAADVVGAGIGEKVIVVEGSSAKKAFENNNVAIDAAIVGIVDGVDS